MIGAPEAKATQGYRLRYGSSFLNRVQQLGGCRTATRANGSGAVKLIDEVLMTLRKDLLSWISDQPSWQQDLARRLTSVSELSDEHRDEAFNIVLVAHNALGEGVSAPTPVAFEDRDLPNVAAAGSTPRLVGLGALRGVGTVADDQELSFLDEGITLVYGPNAAGKSSYVRALKRICRTVDSDRALIGNVFSSKQPVHKTARLTASVRGNVTSRPVDLDARSDSELDVISVFDARCAELY